MIVKDNNQLQDVLDLIAKSGPISYDIETNSLNPRTGEVIGISGASEQGSFYIIHKYWDGVALVELVGKQQLITVVKALQNKQLITHNGSFDTRFTHHYFGVDLWPSLYHDTQLAAHLDDENRFNYKLKELGAEFFGETAKLEQTAMEASIKKNGGSDKQMFMADADALAAYGRKDAELTFNLYKLMHARLEKQGLTNFFYNEEVMPLYKNVTIPMELKGVPVDVPAMQKALVEITADLSALEDSIQMQLTPLLEPFNKWYISKHYPFSLTSRFKTALVQHFKPTFWPKTKSGGFSFSKADLDRAVKKSLIDPETMLYKYASQIEKPDESLIQIIQLRLLAEDGTKYPFNLLSTDHLKRVFFTKHGGPLKETALSHTPKGAPQINDAFLEAMAAKYPWAAEMQTFRSLNKIKGTYIERILETQEEGIFYPQFHQHRTTSGRYSGDLQQLPRVKDEDEVPHPLVLKYTNIIRNFFISAPNWDFVDADYTSLEVVVFADDAQDETLLNVIKNDLDFYSLVAIEAEGIEGYSADKKAPNFLKKHKPNVRQNAKQYALGIRYGEQPYKISKVLNIPEQEARNIFNNYKAKFPRLTARMNELVEQAKTQGFVKSKTGRIRHYPELPNLVRRYGNVLFDGLELWKEYNETPGTYKEMKSIAGTAKNLVNNALNYPIQSMAASIVSRASIAIMEEFAQKRLNAYIAMSVHDELCIHCPEAETPQVAEIMQRLMETTTKLSVPLQAEPAIGKRYGEVK